MFQRRLFSFLVLIVFTLLATACSQEGTPASVQESAPGGGQPEAQVGRRQASAYYLDSCSGCHGADRRGATGPALLLQRLSQEDAYYLDIIKNGKPGTVMPPWGGSLSDAEITTLLGYLRSEPGEASLQWSLEDTKASLEILQPESELPDEPVHQANKVAEISGVHTPTGIFSAFRRYETQGH